MSAFWPDKLVDFVTIITGVVVVIGGITGLRQYFKVLRLEGAKILLSMEEEFRRLLPTYGLIENPQTYEAVIAPLLRKVSGPDLLEPKEVELVDQLDRCFRFFYVCSVLNRDLGIDEGAMNRAYYHYIRGLLDEGKPELCSYLDQYYPRLCAWIRRQPRLEHGGSKAQVKASGAPRDGTVELR
jgi:hypothetical protein